MPELKTLSLYIKRPSSVTSEIPTALLVKTQTSIPTRGRMRNPASKLRIEKSQDHQRGEVLPLMALDHQSEYSVFSFTATGMIFINRFEFVMALR
jgi:hypothetical protein